MVKHTATFGHQEIGEALTFYLAHHARLRVVGTPTFTIHRGYSDMRESSPDRCEVSFDVEEAIGPHEKGGQDK